MIMKIDGNSNFTSKIQGKVKKKKTLYFRSAVKYLIIARTQKHVPIRDKTIKTQAPNSTALRLPILVTAMVCTFSVSVVDPVPVPQRPANTLERPSRPIPLLTTPGVGGLDATNNDDAWYEPTFQV